MNSESRMAVVNCRPEMVVVSGTEVSLFFGTDDEARDFVAAIGEAFKSREQHSDEYARRHGCAEPATAE